jgi:hypothetical protein
MSEVNQSQSQRTTENKIVDAAIACGRGCRAIIGYAPYAGSGKAQRRREALQETACGASPRCRASVGGGSLGKGGRLKIHETPLSLEPPTIVQTSQSAGAPESKPPRCEGRVSPHKSGEHKPSPELRRQMLAEGLRPIVSWYKSPAIGLKGQPTSDGPKSAKQRQDEQKERDKDAGLARFHVKTADDDESRKILSNIGRKFAEGRAAKTDVYHEAFRLTAGNPQIALIGARVLGLRGVRRLLVLRLIGGSTL